MAVSQTSKHAQRFASNQEAHRLLTHLIDRMGLNKRGFLERLSQGDNRGIAMFLAGLGWIAHARSAFVQAIAMDEESLALHRVAEDRKGIVVA